LHHRHDRLEQQPPLVAIRATYSVGIWQQWLKPPPHHVGSFGAYLLGIGSFGAYLLGLLVGGSLLSVPAPSIVIIARPGLVPTPPSRPVQYRCHVTLEGQDQLPEQAPNFGTA
jgi:hypothetical protein